MEAEGQRGYSVAGKIQMWRKQDQVLWKEGEKKEGMEDNGIKRSTERLPSPLAHPSLQRQRDRGCLAFGSVFLGQDLDFFQSLSQCQATVTHRLWGLEDKPGSFLLEGSHTFCCLQRDE